MKHNLLPFLLILVASFSNVLDAQQVIINELYNSSSTDEWVELLVVQDSLDLRGWDLRDFSGSGLAQQPLTFTTSSLWSSVRKGTVILIGTASTTFTEDTDPSDYLLIVKANNGLYFTAAGVFLFAAGSDALQMRNGSDTHIFGVSWGTANAGSIPSPKVHFAGSMTSGNTIYFNEDTLPELTSTTNWTFNTSTQTPGAGNTPTNSAWIADLRGLTQGDGSGTARVQPDTVDGGTLGSIEIIYQRNASFTITDLRIIVPPAFLWSRSRGDVSYTNMTAADTVIGDTVYFNAISLSADSTVITLSNVTSPESTASYPIRTQSRVSQFADVVPIPTLIVFGAPIPIADVKINDANGVPLKLGQLVTIEGIVTVGNEFGSPSYVQDNSGGIGIFGTSFSSSLNIGDEVKVSGIVSPFNGLSELVNPVLHAVVSSGNSLTPADVTCSLLFNDGAGGVEQFEGSLVRLNVVTVTDTFNNPIATWAVSGSGTNYRLHDVTGTVDIRVDNLVNFANTPAPQSAFNVSGVVSQFKTTSPYIGGYQLMPRSSADILTAGPVIATSPEESNIQQTSLTIGWTTINPGTSRVRYGTTTAYELGVAGASDSLLISHSIDLTGLNPGTVYNVQAFSVSGTDTSSAANLVVSTSSPSPSSGQMNVYFNRSVNISVSTGELALGDQDLVPLVVTRINNAHRSIDAAIHSLSGSPGDAVAAALVNAKIRGVKVRVICEYGNRNTNAFNTLVANGIPLIDDRFDPTNGGAGLMHNKFLIFDYRGGAPESIWIWTGSWNLTALQTTTDHQNSIEIQDVSLGGAYTLEFNEMWGSNTDTPDAGNSRFGVRKRNNTPHKFVINSLPVECYFDPGDQTTGHIKNTLRLAEQDIAFALFSFTRTDIADTLIARRAAGRSVRGVMESSASPEQFTHLASNGVDVLLDPFSSLFHHKYAIVDATRGTLGPQWVITGSHNWSNAAENSNNENTVIVQSTRVANLYLQEFAARYYEAGGNDSILLAVQEIGGIPQAFSLSQNYPNPFNPSTAIYYDLPVAGRVSLTVYNLLGQEVVTLVNEEQRVGRYKVEFNGSSFASGLYFYRLRAGTFHAVKKMLLLK